MSVHELKQVCLNFDLMDWKKPTNDRQGPELLARVPREPPAALSGDMMGGEMGITRGRWVM